MFLDSGRIFPVSGAVGLLGRDHPGQVQQSGFWIGSWYLNLMGSMPGDVAETLSFRLELGEWIGTFVQQCTDDGNVNAPRESTTPCTTPEYGFSPASTRCGNVCRIQVSTNKKPLFFYVNLAKVSSLGRLIFFLVLGLHFLTEGCHPFLFAEVSAGARRSPTFSARTR